MKPAHKIWTATGNETATETAQDALRMAADYLEQYQAYSNQMCKIGRGFDPSGPYTTEYLLGILAAAAQDLGGVAS